ncbi:hypothetical protein L226DRAFT_534235 [Lentinus tigrinus ALCF2SS1-7]|uniref:BHLH domain-containing protein n=1 Tax=Lentinus tigrinus ALCF2SS1-6 TaxID=1328759 RepID=A0A5C2SCQ3_9APHY|nr:hypothetical protein L227DRAFT_574064 [Lentinus tigrinus ALCF2SS1-6]RPD76183.1 hypothetical protein L226DRAFT_534235 [Lentinus tigrinus ALCF2SS1-7]
MSAPKEDPMVYAASCNPPRRAKRQRTGSLGGDASPVTPSPTTSASPQQRRVAPRPPILPKGPVAEREFAPPDSDSVSDEEDDYDPGRDAAPAPKRRGRKPGAMSRSARESLRKLNHSRIEKARRTKINETLATLSTLVGDRDQVLSGEKAEVRTEKVEEKAKKGKAKTEEKEFKLDVLVKAVEYMQELIGRVQALETKMCSQCRIYDVPSAANVPPSPKRKRIEDAEMVDVEHVTRRRRQTPEEEDFYGGDDEHGLGAAEEEQPSPMPFATPTHTSAQSTASPRLPPIASWLPHPYVDPSSLMGSSSKAVSMTTRSPQNAQLPSPPPSGRFRPSITLANMPALTLPAPAHPLATQKSMPPPPRQHHQHRKSVSGSPTVSPTWTPEDESAASLLLQISSKPRSSSVSSTSGSSAASSLPRAILPMTPMDEVPRDRAVKSVEVVTPGSLLGMRD